MILRYIGNLILLACGLTYVLGGLSVSAVPEISRFAAPAALLGLITLGALSWKDLSKYWPALAPFLFIGGSWIWADSAPFGVLGSYFTSVAGTAILIGLMHTRVLSLEKLVALILLPAIINAYAYQNGINLTSVLNDISDISAEGRFSGYIGHPSPFVTRLFAPLAVLVVLNNQYSSKRSWFILAVASFAAVAFGLASSGSKKIIVISLPIIILGFTLILGEVLKSKRRDYFFVFALSAAVIAIAVAPSFGLDSVLDLEVFRRLEMAIYGTDDSTTDRLSLLSLAPALIQQAPFFGHGLDQFAVASGAGYYSHNNMVELLVNTGVAGFLIYYGLVVSILFKLWNQTGARHIAVAAIPTLLAMDFTGITYSDRGCLIFLFALMYRAALGAQNEMARKNSIAN